MSAARRFRRRARPSLDQAFKQLEISWESESYYEGPLEDLARQGSRLLHAGQSVAAEHVFRQLHAMCPERPNALNNLARALEKQGRVEEARHLLEVLWREYPDYLFGQTSRARVLLQEGRLAEAEAVLAPLLERKRLHVSEFGALCDCYLALCSLQGQGWTQWLEMWRWMEGVEPRAVRYRSPLYTLLTRSQAG